MRFQLNLISFALLLTVSGHGATMTEYTSRIPSGEVLFQREVGVRSWRSNVDLLLPQFDPKLGTLQSVLIIYSLVYQGWLDAGPIGASADFNSGGPMSLDGTEFAGNGGGGGVGGPPNSRGNMYTVNITGQASAYAHDPDATARAVLAALTGTGTANFRWALTNQGDLSGTGSTHTVELTTESKVRVLYGFEPAVAATPEPASLAMVGLGLGGAALWRRRLRRGGAVEQEQ